MVSFTLTVSLQAVFTPLRSIFLSGTAFLVLVVATPATNAQTLTWIGGQSNSANVSGTANWLNGVAPANDTDYNFVFDAANLVAPGTNVPRTSSQWNRTPGFLSLTLTGNDTYPAFTLSATSSLLLTFKGNVTVTSGDHILNSTITVANDATWNIGANSSLSRTGGNDLLTLAADRTITKTGDGMLSFNVSNTALSGTVEVQQGVMRIRNENNTLGNATVALNGGLFEILSNNGITSTDATTSVIGESTVQLGRSTSGAGVSNTMGALQLGSSKLTVTANNLNTSGTANVTYGATTLSNNATLEVVNGTAAATRVTLGAVGETGGARGLTKTGNGQLLLAASNSYTGNTVVSAGSLILGADGSVGSSGVLDVASGATLDVSAVTGGFVVGGSQTLRGNGTIVGDTKISGTLSPGNSIGALTFADNLTLDLNSTSVFQINGFTAGAFDLVSGSSGGTVAFGGALNIIFSNNFSTSGSVKIFDFENYSGGFGSNFSATGLADGYSATFDDGTGLLTVVPEPSTYALLVLAAAGLGARVIRRRRR
jgi:fibronectin-binding autotransporter adhesin